MRADPRKRGRAAGAAALVEPGPLGVQTSFGFGDRIGLATPGHVAALCAAGGDVAPIFAQQSVRENARIGRAPQHNAAIMHHFDAYKLSIHTGSDKFSIYGLINRYANGRVHVKTAGTSYLEALRVIGSTEPALFRKILDLVTVYK